MSKEFSLAWVHTRRLKITNSLRQRCEPPLRKESSGEFPGIGNVCLDCLWLWLWEPLPHPTQPWVEFGTCRAWISAVFDQGVVVLARDSLAAFEVIYEACDASAGEEGTTYVTSRRNAISLSLNIVLSLVYYIPLHDLWCWNCSFLEVKVSMCF